VTGLEAEPTLAAVDVRVILAGLWTALMLNYLLGDVIRIFAGDFEPGRMQGQEVGQAMWLIAAGVMLIPIAMVVLSLMLPFPAIRWVTLVASAFLVIFNLVGLPYPGLYDNVLILVGFVFNGLIIWQAWGWGG
jgi:hypothetical protein